MCQKFCLVLLSVAMSLAYSSPVPGYLGGYHGLPAATSYSSRIDIHGPEYVKTYAASPVISKAIVTAPVLPSYHHSEPLLGYSSYGLGHHGYGYGYGHGLEHGLGYGHGYGLDHYY